MKWILAAAVAVAFPALAETSTWKLNVAKSKFSPAPGPKSSTLTIDVSADGQKWSNEYVGPDGTAGTQSYDAKFDGKDYPLTGVADADTVSLKKIDAHTLERVDKKDGKVVRKTRRVMSKDGKSFKAEVKGEMQGKKVHHLFVYDKQ